MLRRVKRGRNFTLQQAWNAYITTAGEHRKYGYSKFCALFARHVATNDLSVTTARPGAPAVPAPGGTARRTGPDRGAAGHGCGSCRDAGRGGAGQPRWMVGHRQRRADHPGASAGRGVEGPRPRGTGRGRENHCRGQGTVRDRHRRPARRRPLYSGPVSGVADVGGTAQGRQGACRSCGPGCRGAGRGNQSPGSRGVRAVGATPGARRIRG